MECSTSVHANTLRRACSHFWLQRATSGPGPNDRSILTSAVGLLAELHGDMFRVIAASTGERYMGLGSAASILRRRGLLSGGLAKSLVRIDDAYSIIRHLDIMKVRLILDELESPLAGLMACEHDSFMEDKSGATQLDSDCVDDSVDSCECDDDVEDSSIPVQARNLNEGARAMPLGSASPAPRRVMPLWSASPVTRRENTGASVMPSAKHRRGRCRFGLRAHRRDMCERLFRRTAKVRGLCRLGLRALHWRFGRRLRRPRSSRGVRRAPDRDRPTVDAPIGVWKIGPRITTSHSAAQVGHKHGCQCPCLLASSLSGGSRRPLRLRHAATRSVAPCAKAACRLSLLLGWGGRAVTPLAMSLGSRPFLRGLGSLDARCDDRSRLDFRAPRGSVRRTSTSR